MASTRRDPLIRTLAKQRAADAMWGVPESPEFSMVQRLMHEFQSHAEHEERSLAGYRENAGQSPDPLISFLFELIVADEEKHHQLMGRMIAKLKDELVSTSAQMPARNGLDSAERKRLVKAVEELIDAERKGVEEHEHLRKASRKLRRDVFELFYDVMIHDSRKHLAILDFLRRRLSEG